MTKNSKRISVSLATKEVLDKLKGKDCEFYNDVIEKLIVYYCLKNKIKFCAKK